MFSAVRSLSFGLKLDACKDYESEKTPTPLSPASNTPTDDTPTPTPESPKLDEEDVEVESSE